jgi:hypothetical protein
MLNAVGGSLGLGDRNFHAVIIDPPDPAKNNRIGKAFSLFGAWAC